MTPQSTGVTDNVCKAISLIKCRNKIILRISEKGSGLFITAVTS